MSKRKPMDKERVRERRNQLLDAAAAARLSLTEGVREMRAIAGMTQEEFARHRGVSARVIKALELGQGNPTVTTLNRIGQFFGLEVAFVPVRRKLLSPADTGAQTTDVKLDKDYSALTGSAEWRFIVEAVEAREKLVAGIRELYGTLDKLDGQLDLVQQIRVNLQKDNLNLLPDPSLERPENTTADSLPARKKTKPRST